MSQTKQQQQFMMNLLDFSNLPSKRTQFSNNSPRDIKFTNYQIKKSQQFRSKQNKSDLKQLNLSENTYNVEIDFIPNANQSTHKLLQSFNNIREKLQNANHQNLSLKQEIQTKNKQLQEFYKKQTYLKSLVNERNKKIQKQQNQVTQYKRRLILLKQTNQKIQSDSSQIQSFKIKLTYTLQQNQRLKEQLHKNMQISINQKIQLQEQIQNLKLKDIFSLKNVQEIQNKLYEKNNQFIRLENQYKKLKIIYDQQIYSKKFICQKDILKKENQQLKGKLEQIENKLRKQKNKKYQLQSKLLQLEEKVRLYGTKTDIYQGQINQLSKKMIKVQKNQTQTKKQANAAIEQKLSWEEKFYNSIIIGQQLISRVKRQLMGDVVQLAKISEFKLNKLKNDQKIDLPKKIQIKRNKSSSVKKLRVQSHSSAKKNNQAINNNQEPHVIKQQKELGQIDPLSKTVLKETNFNVNQTNELFDLKKNLFNIATISKPNNLIPKCNNQKQLTNIVQNINIETKIRKERQLMQRKLRQKILFNKIQDSSNQHTKNKLRDQFFNITAMNL